VIDAEDGKKLAFVLNDHAGAELCRFGVAHQFLRPRPGPTAPIRK
jgi:hypothetical protein